jgi:hypothetical protein
MTVQDEFQLILNNTLQKIGRNLLNYQYVENLWKRHLNIADVTAVFDNGVIEIKNIKKSKRNIPMGWLAENHRKSLFASAQDIQSEDVPEKITIKTSFRLEGEALSEERRKQVLILLKERNFLVHKLPEIFDNTSKESCFNLDIRLDEENFRILEELDFLKNISSVCQETIREIQKYLQSDEFISEFTKDF